MTKRILSVLFVCASVVTPLLAQKELKALRSFVKAKNTSEALKEINRLENDSACQCLPKVYDLAIKTQILINDVENEKVYLKKACDTTKLFTSTRQIFYYIHKADSLERAQKEDAGKRHEIDPNKVKLAERYFSNLKAGANYFYSRKNYKEAQNHLDLLLRISKSPLLEDDEQEAIAKDFTMNAYKYTYCAFQNNDFAHVERYKSTLFADERYYPSTLEMYARAAKLSGKNDAFEVYLEKGAVAFPMNSYFFDELAVLYVADERYAQCVELADQQLSADSVSLKAMYLKAFALYKRNEEKACIEVAKQLVANDSTCVYPEANYYAGQFIMNRLETIYLPTRMNSKAFVEAKNEMKTVCSEARPYLERYRTLCPSEHQKLAPLLYKIYLELNMGAEFEDISRYMQ